MADELNPEELENVAGGAAVTGKYTVVENDTIDRIAKKNGTSAATIKFLNPGLTDAQLSPGMVIAVPVYVARV